MENEGHRGTIVRWDPSVIRRQKREKWFLTYLTLPMLLFFSCSSRRARSCISARDISSSMLVISSLARRRFSWKSSQIKDRNTLAMKQSQPRWDALRVGLKPYLSALSCLFDAVKHGPKFSQPFSLHCGHTLHVLLQTQSAGSNLSNTLIIDLAVANSAAADFSPWWS